MTAHTTSQKSEDTYKCHICQDTGWVETKDGFRRCDCYKKEYAERLWKGFGVDPRKVKKLNAYKPYDDLTKKAKEMAIKYIENFDDIRLTEINSFGLFGQPGAGKSHIVISMGASLLNREKPVQVIYMPYLEATRQLKANTNDDEYYLKLSGRYKKAKVLIIDDLFKDKVKNSQLIKDRYGNKAMLTESDIKHVMPILNYRYSNKLPTLISTECTPEILTELDEAQSGRIIESCGENMVVFRDKKYNFRMRKFMKGGN